MYMYTHHSTLSGPLHTVCHDTQTECVRACVWMNRPTFPQVAGEALGIVDCLLSRGIGIQVSSHVLHLQFQLNLYDIYSQ